MESKGEIQKSISGSSLNMKVELSACESSVFNSRLDASEINRKKTIENISPMLQTIISQDASELEVPDFQIRETANPTQMRAETVTE